MRRPIGVEAALVRMADLCARSEQCESDIRTKLFRLGLTGSDVECVMDKLVEGRYVDNARFARSFARDKCRFSAWGRYKISQGLAAKRIASAHIADALEAIGEDDYMDALERVVRAKGKSLDLNGDDRRENRLKLYRHILSRGFESELAQEAVKREARRQKGVEA